MKCPSCGAETQGKFCEYCGSEMPKEKTTVNITNNYYNTTTQESTDNESTAGKCPKCGHSKITFNRERLGTATQSTSRRNIIGSGRKGQSVSQSAYRTIGVCQNCGYTWNPNVNTSQAKSGKKTWLWVLGWIFIFPVPLTILLLRKKDMKPAIKYGIIALAWVLFLVIGLAGNGETETIPPDTSDNTSSDNTIVTSSEEKANETEQEEKLIIELVAGEQGEYGKMVSYNKGTEFEENFYAYFVPAGTYKVTNTGKYMNQINVYSDKTHKTEEGWEEPAEGGMVKLLDVGKSDTITVKEGQHIDIGAENGYFKLEKQ